MKKLLAIVFVLVFALSLSACGPEKSGAADNHLSSNSTSAQAVQNGTSSVERLTADQALDIALSEAGVTKDSIRELERELDLERGTPVWEIDFESGNIEYSYDINAVTGAVLERDRDREN